jgi:solute carrier family 25 (mitochondrial carnitine/acylcarnitine transporter), member 20/29
MFNEGLIETIKKTMLHEGPKGFYKGIGAPMISIPLINSVVFSTYELSRKFFQIFLDKDSLNMPERKFQVMAVALCGFIAGIINSFIVSPVELIKIKLQTQKQKRKYNSSWDAVVKLTAKGGPFGIVCSCDLSEVDS